MSDRYYTDDTLRDFRVSLVPLAALELAVAEGPDQGRCVRIGADPRRIGTARGCELQLTDRTVSRLHCEVVSRADGVLIFDRGSTNGTFVDGVRVHEAYLHPGCSLRLGDTLLQAVAVERPTVLPLSPRTSFGKILGASPQMRHIYAVLDRVGPTNTTVLVTGETGTGKELVARELHEASPRSAGPFVTVDCGAIPENLMESELFGHVRGAFTGATSGRSGVFEEADGGTLFFDEIGELPVSLQPKLLRVLETRTVRRVGGGASRRVDVRIIAATNRSLAQSVNEGTFREDLYYRLAVIEVELPPLRARREDVPVLVQHFVKHFGGADATLPEGVTAALSHRGWPGNVRELRNYVQRALSLGWEAERGFAPFSNQAQSGPLALADLPFKEARDVWVERFEGVYVQALLEKTGGNVSRAAELAGLNRRSLHRIILRLGLRGSDTDPDG